MLTGHSARPEQIQDKKEMKRGPLSDTDTTERLELKLILRQSYA